jgi:hypothetical protein
MVTRRHCCYQLLFPLKLDELWWHSYALPLRGATPSAVVLGTGLSIGITIEVTPFIDILLARLLLFLQEEFLFNAYRSLRREPTSHGFRVIFLPWLVRRGYFILVF